MAARRPVIAGDGFGPRAIGDGRELRVDELLAAPLRMPRPARTTAPVTALRGLGPGTASAMREELGVETIEDLLRRLPRAYKEAPPEVAMRDLEPGMEAVVRGVIGTVGRYEAGPPRGRRRRGGRLTATVADISGRGSVRAVWFNQPWLVEQLRPGVPVLLVGTLESRGFVVSAHEILARDGEAPADGSPAGGEAGAGAAAGDEPPAVRAWRRADSAPAAIHSRAPVPLHPAGERVPARRLRRFVWQALARCEDTLDPLPGRLRARLGLPAPAAALRAVHFPALAGGRAEEARQALAFEELLLHQVVLARRRSRRESLAGPRLPPAGQLYARWAEGLPFEPTEDQRRAIAEIAADLESGRPMQRLLMGEVGSGKTVVALAAMVRVAEAGGQAAIMAPTEVLAEQHAASVERLLEGTGIECGLLTGSTPASERKRLLHALETGELALLVGTHALLEEAVRFADLRLAVVDEQHRFGVRQRGLLEGKGRGGLRPHLLHMSATPIPRTLALLGYGDLDASELRTLPAGRRPVETRLVEPRGRRAAFAELRERLRQGRQAYVICPLVEESEALQAKAARVEGERLAAEELAGFRVDVLHGRMAAAEKRDTMAAFARGEIDVLVATTVVEVGVDVANATTIVIEGAERFGLAQLHQLRGRVGRGRHASLCLLMPEQLGENARRRLDALVAHHDGFQLAEMDLRLRGAGEMLGERQHGLPEFYAALFPADEQLLARAGRLARRIAALEGEKAREFELLTALAEARFGGVSEERIAA